MTSYIFHEAGSVPGVPGTFAHCQVEVDEDGNVETAPLPLHPAPVAKDSSSSLPQEKTTDPTPDHPPEASAQEAPPPEATRDAPPTQQEGA